MVLLALTVVGMMLVARIMEQIFLIDLTPFMKLILLAFLLGGS